jgi:hypothetical protein
MRPYHAFLHEELTFGASELPLQAQGRLKAELVLGRWLILHLPN